MAEPLLVAQTAGNTALALLPALANRHGLIAGATGTGKTVTLQALAQKFSAHRRAGVHGRREGRSRRASRSRAAHRPRSRSALELLEASRISPFAACPVVFWDVFGEQGHPVRATISEMGPLLLGAPAQPERHPGRRADARLQDRRRQRPAAARSKDLRAMLQYVGDNAQAVHHRVRQRLGGLDRRDPARPARARSSRAARSSSASRRSTSTT